jgi:uncharacterized protein YbaR (Trm112 family)
MRFVLASIYGALVTRKFVLQNLITKHPIVVHLFTDIPNHKMPLMSFLQKRCHRSYVVTTLYVCIDIRIQKKTEMLMCQAKYLVKIRGQIPVFLQYQARMGKPSR